MSVVTKQSGFLLPTVYAGVKQSWHTCEEQPSIWNPLFKHLLNVLGWFFCVVILCHYAVMKKKHKSNKTNDSGGAEASALVQWIRGFHFSVILSFILHRQTDRIGSLLLFPPLPEAQTCLESNWVDGGRVPPYDHWERIGPSGLVTAIYLHTALVLSDQLAEHL